MIGLYVKRPVNYLIIKLMILIFSVVFITTPHVKSQESLVTDFSQYLNETSKKSDTSFFLRHDPKKATIYSMLLPGLGQAYNKKYWKIPIVYAGFGVCYYFISFNNKEYQAWSDAYYHSLNNPDQSEPPVNDYEKMYGNYPNIMKDQKDYYRRNRDLTYIFTGIWYLLNIIDATVDAHLFSWEVDELLSLRFEPTLTEPIYGFRPSGGLKLTLNLK